MITLFACKSSDINITNLVNDLNEFIMGASVLKRESDFYPSGFYYVIEGKGFSLKVSETDDDEFYNYKITFLVNGQKESTVKDQLAKYLLKNNCEVVVPESPNKGTRIRQPVIDSNGNMVWEPKSN